jgi:hypothetical protein
MARRSGHAKGVGLNHRRVHAKHRKGQGAESRSLTYLLFVSNQSIEPEAHTRQKPRRLSSSRGEWKK